MQLDQALFGYSSGHRRLASSCALPQSDERLLVRMTDLSGSRVATGFDSYLSGYSLGQDSRYAIAKTWYAPECERPGCVWTQVFFMTAEVWETTNPQDVLQAFRRPKDIKLELERYSRQVDVAVSMSPSSGFNFDAAQMLCDAVYSSQNTVVVLAGRENDDLDPVILEMLWQRPSPLRGTFSFCTGALSFLRIDDQPLRLQVMPIRAAKSIRDQDITLLSLDSKVRSNLNRCAELMAHDLQHHDRTYRAFLDDMSHGWPVVAEQDAAIAMEMFTRAYLTLQDYAEGRETVAQVLRVAAELSDDYRFTLLFQRLVGVLEVPRAAWVYAEGILNGEYGDALVREPSLAEVARMATDDDPERAFRLVREHLYPANQGSAKASIVEGFFRGMSLDFLVSKRPIEPQILLAWIKSHSEAMQDSRFWLLQNSFDESAEIAEALEDSFSESTILQALLRADRLDLLLLRLRTQGKDGALKAFGLAEALDVTSSHDRLRLCALRDEIAVHAEHIVSVNTTSKSISPSQLFVLGGAHVAAERLLELCPDKKTWIDVLRILGNKFDRLQLKAFELGVKHDGWWKVAELSFTPIYERMADRNLSYEDWSVLKRFLPKLAGWEKWDKCERLRRALVDTLRRDGESLGSITMLKDDAKEMLMLTNSKYR